MGQPRQPAAPGYGEKALGLAVAAGLVVVVIAALLAGGPGQPTGAPNPVILPAAPAAPPARAPDPAARTWYEDSTEARTAVTTAATAVRRHIEAEDGRALEPACADLAAQAGRAGAHPGAPDPQAQALWSAGASSYTQAAASCGQLFDGTPVEVGVLLGRTTAALGQADAAWSDLARLLAHGS